MNPGISRKKIETNRCYCRHRERFLVEDATESRGKDRPGRKERDRRQNVGFYRQARLSVVATARVTGTTTMAAVMNVTAMQADSSTSCKPFTH